jgi:serine/threonine protein kinase
MECAHCQTPLPDTARYCYVCGSDLTGGDGAEPRDRMEELRDRLSRALDGRYVVGELLGAGAMGAVFLADDLALERTVAIKVLPPELSRDEGVVTRFQREAKTAAKLDHRHIIPIHRVDSEAGLNYFVMKYVAGRSLETVLLDSGPLPIPLALRVLYEAAAALGHAHQRGVVHRDVKPANIMLDVDDRVILTDFGISKAGDVKADLTQSGMVIGTPFYMAPEQALGQAVDGRADQYALGVVGFEMLTGRLPFDGESAHAIIFRHVHEAPPRVAALRPDVPDHVDAAIARALSKAPSNRFASMEEFAVALGAEPDLVSGKATPTPARITRSILAPTTPPRLAPTRTLGSAPALDVSPPARGGRRWATLVFLAAATLAGLGWVRSRGMTTARRELRQMSSRAFASLGALRGLSPQYDTIYPGAARRSTVVRPSPASDARGRRTTSRDARRVAMLTVTSEPRATLYVDGTEVGETPIVDRPLVVGRTYLLRIQRDGYHTKRELVTATNAAAIRRRFVLQRER